MAEAGPKQSPDRASTDASLLDERDKTDTELARTRSAVEISADEVVQVARDRADQVLQKQRDLIDHPLAAVPGEAVADARDRADAAISEERATEDAAATFEREARRRALTALLDLEREETDQHLLTERGTADAAVASRDTFLAMVSHDLRSMLHGIEMTVALLEQDAPAEERRGSVRGRVATIRRFGKRMNHLIADLTDLATIESGRPLVVPDVLDLAALLREVDEAFQPVAAARGLAFSSVLIARPRPARFDHHRVFQVLTNLISNSVKFTPPGGRIGLLVEAIDGLIRFSVTDTGKGIPADKLEAIFERFWQVSGHDRRGLGLGLYISKCIVQAHGGTIWAESAPGHGSSLFFTLPQEPSPGSPGA